MTIGSNTPLIIHLYHTFYVEKWKNKKTDPIKNNKYLIYSFTESNNYNQILSIINQIKKSST